MKETLEVGKEMVQCECNRFSTYSSDKDDLGPR